MKPDYIKRFEEMGLGLFVHYGLYSVVQKGEWHYNTLMTDKQKQDYFSFFCKEQKVSESSLSSSSSKGLLTRYFGTTCY